METWPCCCLIHPWTLASRQPRTRTLAASLLTRQYPKKADTNLCHRAKTLVCNNLQPHAEALRWQGHDGHLCAQAPKAKTLTELQTAYRTSLPSVDTVDCVAMPNTVYACIVCFTVPFSEHSSSEPFEELQCSQPSAVNPKTEPFR